MFIQRMTVFIISLLMSQFLSASVEGVLPLEKFTVESAGIGLSGRVVVTGTQDTQGITSLSIIAFGKTMIVSEHDLQFLKGLYANGLQISYSEGYKETGGKNLYISLFKGFNSGERQQISVSISENGRFSVLQPSSVEILK